MTQAQGIYKQFSYKKQTGLGSPASGSGGQLLRRETATLTLQKDTFNSNEIVSHQQYTGDKFGVGKVNGSLNGVLSPATYADFFGSLARSDFASVSAITGLTLTIAGTGPYTLTRSTGSFLSGGIKVGMVVRITAGTFTGTARNINLVVTAVTALTLTVLVLNGSSLTAQVDVASATLSIVGKKTTAPLTGHTNDYYTFEEWFADISRSRVKTDVQVGKIDVAIPASGNTTIAMTMLALDETLDNAQVLTSPAAETTTSIVTGADAIILIDGAQQAIATSLNLSIDGQAQHGENRIGANRVGDIIKGDLKVSGSFTVLYEDETIGTLFDNETATSIIVVLPCDATATSDFITFVLPRCFIFSNEGDDGKKQVVRTCNYTAEINSAGGSALANDKTILMIQDSAAA